MQPSDEPTNLESFTRDLRQTGDAHLAAAVNAFRGELAALGLDWDVSGERARNACQALLGCESEPERHDAIRSVLSLVQSVITAETVRRLDREWVRWMGEETSK